MNVNVGSLSGIITIRKGLDPDNLKQVTKFNNLILDQGLLEYLRNDNYIRYCHIGTGNSIPDPSQTQLDDLLFSSSYAFAYDIEGSDVTDPSNPYLYRLRAMRFSPPSDGSGYTFSEIGFGWDMSGNLFNRALTKDPSGNIAPIFVAPYEYIEIEIEVRLYIPTGTYSGTFTPKNGDYITRTWTANASSEYGIIKSEFWNMTSYKAPGVNTFIVNSSTSLPAVFSTVGTSPEFGYLGEYNGGVSIDNTTSRGRAQLRIGASELSNKDIGSITVNRFCGTGWNIAFNPPLTKPAENSVVLSLYISVKRKDD